MKGERMNIHPEKPIFEYSEITEFIYIGTNKCCHSHFEKSLIKRGIKANISLEDKKLDQPFGVDYYLWLPTKDHYPPTMKQMIIGAHFIQWMIDNNIKVYVHCREGHTRAPTLVAAYFIFKGMRFDEAIKNIKTKRPATHITPAQKKALKKFKKYVEDKNAIQKNY